MCAIIGAVVWGDALHKRLANNVLDIIIRKSHERGRDGRGFRVINQSGVVFEMRDITRANGDQWKYTNLIPLTNGPATLIGNLRAEPTTEYVAVKRKFDQQPYTHNPWSIVHNGTIANDKELRTHRLKTTVDSAAIVELLIRQASSDGAFLYCIKRLKGSYAILAQHDAASGLLAAVNYRPLWYLWTEYGIFLASARHYLPHIGPITMMKPYTVAKFSNGAFSPIEELASLRDETQRRALVVCSGGLDSVVAATYVKRHLGLDTALIHFRYGSRAEDREVVAVQAVAQALGVPCTIFPLLVYKPEDSPLLRADSAIAGGEAGAEFAHEWVPARNLLLLSVATAFAEANGFDTIALGNNLEEAGAYPDNEPEFIARFSDLLPFATGDGKRVGIIQPVGNLMKHEIVALGHQLEAPMHLTWSCYRAGPVHCGTCGPCYMRRKAFEINKLPEVIPYANG